MTFCRICGKKLQQEETEYCFTCHEFHKWRYDKKKREQVLQEYDKLYLRKKQ